MRESMRILEMRRTLGWRDWGGPVAETIQEAIDILNELGVDWCLIGAHAVGAYGEPRATLDVDLLVDDRKLETILRRFRERFGELDEVDIGHVAAGSQDLPRRAGGARGAAGQDRPGRADLDLAAAQEAAKPASKQLCTQREPVCVLT